MPTHSLAIASGGFLGTLARLLIHYFSPFQESAFPWVTLVENASGAFLLGLTSAIVCVSYRYAQQTRAFLCTGLLGSYTSLSAFSIELVHLQQSPNLFFGYFFASLVLGVSAAWLGVVAGRSGLMRRSKKC